MDLQRMERWELSSQVIRCSRSYSNSFPPVRLYLLARLCEKNRKSPANSSARSPGNVMRNRDLSGQHKKRRGEHPNWSPRIHMQGPCSPGTESTHCLISFSPTFPKNSPTFLFHAVSS